MIYVKKLMATCAALALAATSTLPLTAFAAEDDLVFSASLDKTSYNVGDIATLTVKVDKNTGSNSWLALVGYDEGLTPKKVTAQEMVDGNASDKHSNAVKTLNPIKLSWTNGSTTYGDVFDEIPTGHTDEDAYNWTYTGAVSVITFEVTSAGSHTITLALDEESKPFRTTGTMGTPGANVYLNYSVSTPTINFTAEGGTQDEVTLSADATLEVEAGKTKQLGYTVTPTETAVSFVSTDPTIATVSDSGVVTGVKAGTTTITTTAGDKTATTTVTVKPEEVTPVAVTGVTAQDLTLAALSDAKLDYTVAPDNADNKAVTFNVADTSIAKISDTGVVTGLLPGTTTVTVKTVDGGFEDTATITVKKVELPFGTYTDTSDAIDVGKLISSNVPSDLVGSLAVESDNPAVINPSLSGGRITYSTGDATGTANVNIYVTNPTDNSKIVLATFKVTVEEKPEVDFIVKFKEDPITMKVGDKKVLELVVDPADYEFALDYNNLLSGEWGLKFDNESILGMEGEKDGDGYFIPSSATVTALKSGTVVISAYNKDYVDKQTFEMIPVKCTVVVKSVLPADTTHTYNPGDTRGTQPSTDPVGRAKVSPYVAALPATTSTSSTAGPIAATGGEMMVSDNDETGNAPAIAAAALGVIALGFVVVARKKRHN